jgi:hypothetical protein
LLRTPVGFETIMGRTISPGSVLWPGTSCGVSATLSGASKPDANGPDGTEAISYKYSWRTPHALTLGDGEATFRERNPGFRASGLRLTAATQGANAPE